MRYRQSGFTIVELLIVIVVIAILAAISVVAYNGLQDRAYATKASSVVDGYVKVIEMYKIDNGEYPSTEEDVGGMACLGEASNYPQADNFAANVCGDGDGGAFAPKTSNSLNNKLKAYVASLPDGSLPKIDDDTLSFRGVFYESFGQDAYIYYYVKGDQECPKGVKVSLQGITLCRVDIGEEHSSSGVI